MFKNAIVVKFREFIQQNRHEVKVETDKLIK